jgi:thiol-disulfide isomerase/thioredoxin
MRRSYVIGAAVLLVLVVTTWVRSNRLARPTGEMANLEFTIKDMAGTDVRLADFKGKPIVVNFWATWCEPCKLEIPSLVEFTTKYKSEGLTILGISIDDSPAELQQFAKTFQMNYPILVGRDRDDVGQAFGLGMGIPTSVFIRRDGTLAGRLEGIAATDWLERKIQSLF